MRTSSVRRLAAPTRLLLVPVGLMASSAQAGPLAPRVFNITQPEVFGGEAISFG